MIYNDGTLGAFFHKLMTDYGLWSEDADAVLEMIVDNPTEEALFGEQVKDYPSSVLVTGWIVVTSTVLKYIDEHKPGHVSRRLFDLKAN